MNIVELVTSAGAGALIAGVLVSVINNVFSRGERKTSATKALVEANQEFVKSVTEHYDRLYQEMVEIKRSINVLTEIVDEVLPQMTGISAEQKKQLRDANTAAKMAT